MNEEREKIEIGDEVMFVDIKAHYIAPFHTPQVGERGIVVRQELLKTGRFGWAVRWSQGEIIVCATDSLTITEKGAAKAFKLGETVVFKKDLSFCPAGTFGNVTGFKGKHYEVKFENGVKWLCSEDEIGRPTKAETNLHNVVIKLTGALANLEGVLKQCQK